MSEGSRFVEAGRKGGRNTRERYGSDFFRAIGSKGGAATAEEHGSEHYARIGKVGGTKGGARIRELVAKARAVEAEEAAQTGGY